MDNILQKEKTNIKQHCICYQQVLNFPDITNILSYVCDRTNLYIKQIDKSQRKNYGQFFTDINIAKYMANLVNKNKPSVKILDPGAGSGILSAAILDKLKNNNVTQNIEITLYENDKNILPLLYSNMEYIKKQLEQCDILFQYKIIDKNFITTNSKVWNDDISNYEKFDIVISNPPYLKISANSPEAKIMKDIVYGQPNLYFLFMAMSAKLTKYNGENIFIVPRSFASGLYFSAFRKWYFNNMFFSNIHIFNSRNNVFKSDDILQETIIYKSIKTNLKYSNLLISTSEDSNRMENSYKFNTSSKLCINNNILFIPSSEEDISILKFVQKWTYSLLKNGFRAKTGQVVDFREKEFLSYEDNINSIPLLWAYNFENSNILFPKLVKDKPQFLLNNISSKRLQIKNDNYLLVKRFTAKEEKKRIQCALLDKDKFRNYDTISAENHLNVISKEVGGATIEELKGLFILFNSNIIDKYFRLFNGSTQVNAGDLNRIPLPSLTDIVNLSNCYDGKILTSSLCDKILIEQFS